MTTDTQQSERSEAQDRPTNPILVVLAWLIVAVPLAYGLWQTLVTASKLLG